MKQAGIWYIIDDVDYMAYCQLYGIWYIVSDMHYVIYDKLHMM